MSSIPQDIRENMMFVLKDEENKTDLENLAVLSRVGLKLCSSVSAEIDADASSAQSTALIDLGLRLSDATNHGSLLEIILHNTSGYCVLLAINDDYMIFSALSAKYRIGYYLGYLRELAKKLNRLISGDIETKMALSLEESELEKLKQKKIAEKTIIRPKKPSIEKDKEALNDLLGFLDDWEKEGIDLSDLESDNENNIVSIPKSMTSGLQGAGQAIGLPETSVPQEATSSISKTPAEFKIYDDEVPPVPLEDYTPMEIEEEPIEQETKVVEQLPLPSFEDLTPPDFDSEFSASEYDTKYVLNEESEAFDAILKELGYDKEED
ncbi:MAG: hypothetical protein ACTSRI_04040 [Promethearchaeota archaeon]